MGLLGILVPEDQTCSVEPWAAEHNDLARPPVQVVKHERPGAEGDLEQAVKPHGNYNQQDVHCLLLKNLIAPDFETAS